MINSDHFSNFPKLPFLFFMWFENMVARVLSSPNTVPHLLFAGWGVGGLPGSFDCMLSSFSFLGAFAKGNPDVVVLPMDWDCHVPQPFLSWPMRSLAVEVGKLLPGSLLFLNGPHYVFLITVSQRFGVFLSDLSHTSPLPFPSC